mmetsp:Transcript_15108/g.19749  ORF Transcript_15108/g.19749 Transcript_15108/m.19749 type:complete len:191 (+) Transcript_15108:105-677(+)
MRLVGKKYRYVVLTAPWFAAIAGFMSGLQPAGVEWRWFSFHPLLMTMGFVGMMANGIMVKKLGGYVNTKIHAKLSLAGMFMALGGLYVIYTNKEWYGRRHFTSAHSKAGLLCLIGCVLVGTAGTVFLHPDWGISKTNKNIRLCHKWLARAVVLLGWITCFAGLQQICYDNYFMAFYGLPLLALVPVTVVP